MTRQLLGLMLLFATTAMAGEPQFVDVTPTFVQPSMSGRDIFTYYCATCHGRDARGQFPADRVKAFITEGRPDTSAHGSSDMPVWGPIFRSLDPSDTVAAARIDNIITYLKSIQVK
jgi:mono/diheme cytochrome c family protein